MHPSPYNLCTHCSNESMSRHSLLDDATDCIRGYSRRAALSGSGEKSTKTRKVYRVRGNRRATLPGSGDKSAKPREVYRGRGGRRAPLLGSGDKSKKTRKYLLITNTLFQLKNRYKGTWQHPRSKHWHQIDFIIIKSRDRKEVKKARAIIGSDSCLTDHRLVKCEIKIKPQKKMRLQAKVKNPAVQQKFQTTLANSLSLLTNEKPVIETWNDLKNVILDSCTKTIGSKKKVNQNWLYENDAEIKLLIEHRRATFIKWQRNPRTRSSKSDLLRARNELQHRTRELKNKWWKNKAAELQMLAKQNSKAFFAGMKAVYGPSTYGPTPLRTADGALVKDPACICPGAMEGALLQFAES